MKKILVLMLALLVITSLALLAACGGNDDTTASTTDQTTNSDTVTTTEAPVIGPVPDDIVSKDENGVTVTSLGDKLVMTLGKNADGDIVYTLATKEGTTVIGESVMGIISTNFGGFANATFKDVTAKELKVSYEHLGTFSVMTDHCVAATVTMQSGTYEFAIEIKLYDNGVAFRYNLPATSRLRVVSGEETAFAVQNIGKVWYGTNSDCYESVIKSSNYASIATSDKLTGPLMIELANDAGYVSLMEGYVQAGNYIGTCFASTGDDGIFKVVGSWTSGKDFDTYTATGDIITGWRVINYATELGDIVNNHNIYHTALGMEGTTSSYTDTDWITSGKSVWSWMNEGVAFDSQITYTLNAAKLGFAYNIIDEGYLSWENYEDKLLELGLLGEDNNVKQILWATVANRNGFRITNEAQAKSVMKQIADLHLSGIKLDFFDPESESDTHLIQTAILEEGMANHVIVNFHGVHKPTAYSVLYPNELTREGIRGLENVSRSAITTQAAYITAQYYTRLLSGHADFTPDVNTAMQIASLVVLDSPLMVIATAPEDIMNNPALEMIRAIPTVWDQTVFLDGQIGSYVSLAKEKDGVWYIGGIVSATGISAKVDLSGILGDGEYLLTGWVDQSTSVKNQMTQVVTKDTVLDLGTIRNGCGYVFQITKLSISQHGGEITGPITVKTASASAVVKYTIDGSDPMTSATAITAGETISLSDTALLRVAITEGDGKGTELSYQFNKIEYIAADYSVVYGDGETTLTLTPTLEGAKIYYTVDGTTPTASSALYTAPIVMTDSTTLKVIAISASGKTSVVRTISIGVRNDVHSLTPDVYLGNKPVSSRTDWGSCTYNKSMNSTTLSLGGWDVNSGTKFEYGISANANAEFVYNIPENATEFVGVAGIDDSVYNNATQNYKASTIVKIYIDGQLMYTTATLGRGQYEQIRVEIPTGATQIKIEFGDAGDGITCDNVDLCDAGFILGS